MPISRKPKSKTENEQMFTDPVAQVFEDVDNENGEAEKSEADKRMEEMAKQLADMQTRMSEMNQLNMQLMSGGSQWRSQTIEQPQYEDVNKVKLPDPALEPEQYDAALAERARIRAENARKKQDFDARAERDVKEKADQLKAAFVKKYPEMAEDEEKLTFATSQVANAAKRRGLDLERYMFLNQDRFIDDVADKYTNLFGDPREEGDNDFDYQEERPRSRRAAADSSSRRASQRRSREEDDEGRSTGIFGGTDSGGRPNRSRDRDEEKGGGMIEDLHEMQRKTGFW